MDDGNVELSNRVLISNPEDLSTKIQVSTSIDSLLDEFLRNNRTCTHTHTCNLPGPRRETHTHTCYHAHTHVFPSEEEDDLTIERDRSVSKPRRPSGNREAVRKYREKKKAHTAYLEEEVKKLQALNQQLMRKLQGQGVLEAEVLRLRKLLLDLRGKIDCELGLFPFQTQCNASNGFKEGDCGAFLSSNSGGGNGKKFVPPSVGNCEASITDCHADGKEMCRVESLVSSSSQAE